MFSAGRERDRWEQIGKIAIENKITMEIEICYAISI